jgi:hypothetical protein
VFFFILGENLYLTVLVAVIHPLGGYPFVCPDKNVKC